MTAKIYNEIRKARKGPLAPAPLVVIGRMSSMEKLCNLSEFYLNPLVQYFRGGGDGGVH